MSGFLFRYTIERALFQWVLRTEADWYVRPTYEDAFKLMTELRAEAEAEWNAARKGNDDEGS